jgi:hypothetical protein
MSMSNAQALERQTTAHPDTTREEQPADPFFAMIQRAASDPTVDMDKMERLVAMRERNMALGAEQAFNVAMNAAQTEMGRIPANKLNPQTKSKYASYDKLDEVLRPIYTRHGFSLSYDEGDSPKPEHVRVLCYVSHIGGHTRTYHRDMPADGKGAKGGDVMTKTHAAGAAGSYGARYLLQGIFNVAVGRDDADGNMPGDTITEDQVEELKALIDRAVAARPGTNHADWIASFLEFMGAPGLNAIAAKDFGKAKSNIEYAIKQGGKK